MSTTDRIEKKIVLRAPRERVWNAISDAKQFGTWFGVEFDGPFVAGKHMAGRMTPTQVDAEVARMQEPYKGKAFDCTIDRIEPMRVFSFRWHPFAIDSSVDYSSEPTTLVEFRLVEVKEGTQLTIVESGFDQLPAARRAEAFRMNDGGWSGQIKNIQRHVTPL
jgi:uncharacterized protein YndB with AHSA1/START domain